MTDTHIDKGVGTAREEKLAIVGYVQAHHSFLVSLEREKKLVSVERPRLCSVSSAFLGFPHPEGGRLRNLCADQNVSALQSSNQTVIVQDSERLNAAACVETVCDRHGKVSLERWTFGR